MVMIGMGGEARTPSYHSIGSPRYGGCVGALLHFFDWNPGKRFYSTKRLNASKPEEGLRRSRSMRSDHGSAARTRMIFESQPQAGCEEGTGDSREFFSVDDVSSSRAPSVVARLMGLDSLPKGPYQPARHRRSQSYSGAGELPFSFMTTNRVEEEPPVVLQELLQRDFKASKKTLRDRMPGFAKRAHEQYENRFTKKGAALKVLRCRQDECLSPYIDMPDVETIKAKQPFLLRLAPTTASSPSEVSTPGIVAELTAGWPLAGKISRESSFRSERSSLLDSECSSSRPVSAKPSQPALATVARKIFQGRRRAGTSWNESEDSGSTSFQVEEDFRASPQHRKTHVAARDAPLKIVSKSLSPQARRDRNVRTKTATHHETSVQDFKTSGTRIHKAVQSIRASSNITAASEGVDNSALRDQRQPLIQSRSRSTDFQSPVLESATSRTISLASTSHDSTSSTASQTSIVPPIATVAASRSKRARPGSNITRTSKPDAVSTPASSNLPSKAPPLDGYRAPKVVKHNQKTGLPKQTLIPAKPLPAENANAHKGGVASSKQSTKNSLQGIQRVRVTTLTAAPPPLNDRLNLDELATRSNTAESAVVDVNGGTPFCSRKSSTAPKHSRARSIGDAFTELPPESNPCADTSVPISTELDTQLLKPKIATLEGVCEPVFQVDLQEFLAAGADDLRWDDEEQRVELDSPELSGRFCERSCSGPSVSTTSVDASDVEDGRNGDAWSSCASYNAADLDSPRAFELPDTDADECDLHEPKSTPMYVEKIKTAADGAPSLPSPVSILNSPFHDEPCTTSECALNSDEDAAVTSTPQSEPPLPTSEPPLLPTSPTNSSSKLRQALLDISLFQSFTFSYKEVTRPKESVQGFVQELLSPAVPGSSSPTSFDQKLALDSVPNNSNHHKTVESLLQDRLLWPCGDRKLLVDAVNEAFALAVWHRWRCEEILPGRGCFCASSLGAGEAAGVGEVYAKIEEWRRLPALSIDVLVEREMRVGGGDWKGFRGEVAAVGGEIESWIWKGVVEDVVGDLVASWKPR